MHNSGRGFRTILTLVLNIQLEHVVHFLTVITTMVDRQHHRRVSRNILVEEFSLVDTTNHQICFAETNQ